MRKSTFLLLLATSSVAGLLLAESRGCGDLGRRLDERTLARIHGAGAGYGQLSTMNCDQANAGNGVAAADCHTAPPGTSCVDCGVSTTPTANVLSGYTSVSGFFYKPSIALGCGTRGSSGVCDLYGGGFCDLSLGGVFYCSSINDYGQQTGPGGQ